MNNLVKLWGYKEEMINGALCYTKEYNQFITIVIHKTTIFVKNKVIYKQKDDIENEMKALKQGQYEYRQSKL